MKGVQSHKYATISITISCVIRAPRACVRWTLTSCDPNDIRYGNCSVKQTVAVDCG